MPHDIVNSMRALREELAQRLSLVPEYRALVALDRSIDEICAIMRESHAAAESHAAVDPQVVLAPAQVSPPQSAAQPQPQAQARKSAVATAFADALAAKIDRRVAARDVAFPPAQRA